MKRLLITMLVIGLAGSALASEEDATTSLSYISYLERYATVQPADQQDTLEAVTNMPLISGDRIDTAREARVEVCLADGSVLWLDEYSSLSFDAVAHSRDGAGERTVLFLAEGRIMLEIPDYTMASESTRIDGPSGTVYLNRPGLYRVETLRTGGVRLEVWEGLAEASTSSGGVLVRAESSAEIGGGQVTGEENLITWHDDFARWVDQRRQVYEGEGALHLEARYQRQAGQLDNYGSWVYVDTYNTWAWQPSVAADWRPYTYGRWYWTPVGWNWISYEPWGWMPYHYGSWYHAGHHGWVWSWHPYWSPAWVSWIWWPGYVGWCPTGYYDHWWWDRYHYWYGYDRPGSHGRPGYGGSAGTPRGDVVPRTGGDRVSAIRDGEPMPPSRLSLDLNGRVRLDAVDRKPWNVVRVDDFASPHLPRLAQPGDRVFDANGRVEAMVRSGPLTTRSPDSGRLAGDIDGAFRQVAAQSRTDLGPVLGRDPNLKPEQALQLVKPSSVAAISRRAASTGERPAAAIRPSPANADTVSGGEIRDRRGGPNLYRPTLTPGSSSRPSAPSTATTSGTGRSRSLPPSTSRTRQLPSAPSATGVRSPTTRTVPGSMRTPLSSTPAVPRSLSGRSSSGSSPRPVIVPRTSPSRPSRSAGSIPSSSRSSGSSPSTRVSPSTSSRSRSSSSATRSSSPRSSSSRSSGASSSRSRSSSSSTKTTSKTRK